MIVSIHQPNYLPWIGYFKKIEYADVFVILDNVKYTKRDWRNRNKIRTSQCWTWLTVPIKSQNDHLLGEIMIDYTTNWQENHRKTIFYNYKKSKFLKNYFQFFEDVYSKNLEKLIQLDVEIIKYLMEKFEIKTKIIFASELGISENTQNKNLAICKELGADLYLSGEDGKNYLDIEEFNKNDIKVEFQNFKHPRYTQCYEPFISHMSAIDLLFNEGPNAKKILINSKNF